MKKLLSVVLALAIVASCLTVFGAMATAASTEPKAVKVTHTAVSTTAKSDFVFKAPFLSAADFGDKDSLDVIFVLKNPLDKELSISLKAQEEGTYRDNLYTTNELNAENKPTGTKVGFKNSVIVPANGTSEFKLTFPKTGYFYHTNANIGFTSENYLDKLCLRVQCGAETLEVGSVLEIAIKDNDALNEKFVNAAAGLTWMGRTTTVEKTTASTMSSVIKDALAATPTPVPTATPVVDKAVTNGDAEDGKTNWGVYNGGSTTIVADPDNASNHVAYHVATGKYHSVAFDFGPAIIKDAANGYKGEGAGTYVISFKAKAEAGKSGKFTVTINSQEHISKGQTIGSYTTTANTWQGSSTPIEMTDQWQSFTSEVNISEAFLENVYAIQATGLKNKIYQLVLRLDGASAAYKDSEFFGYYVDDLTITKKAEATPTATAAPGTLAPGATATPVPDPVGVKFEIVEELTGGYPYFRTNANLTAAQAKDGKITKTHVVYNVSKVDLAVTVMYQNEWAGIAGLSKTETISAGAKTTFTFDIPVNADGTATDAKIDLSKITFRVQIENAKGEAIPAGSAFIVAGGKTDVIYNITKGSVQPVAGMTPAGKVAVSSVTELPSTGKDETPVVKVPTGVTFTATGDIEHTSTGYLLSKTGVITSADIKNGEITKKYTIKNNGTDDITIIFSVQALVESGGTKTWAGPAAGEPVTIEAGKEETVEFTFEVNDDKTVTIKDVDVTLDNLFYRFDVKGAEGNGSFEKGASFTVYCKGNDVDLIKDGQKYNKAWVGEVIYTSASNNTGDVLPVALIATLTVATIALVVVAKKRKEN